MSGHSKWASIKHKKAATDAKRGKLFTKLIKEITIAARAGGGSPDANPRLRTAVQTARDQNMPLENITRAIKKGTGELPGQSIEEVTYEGYAANGVAVLVEVTTDNKNRTTSEIRNLFAKHHGNMAGAGSVSWIFEKKGLLTVSKSALTEEQVMEAALEAGADDVAVSDDVYEVYAPPTHFEAVKQALIARGLKPEVAELTMKPKSTVRVEGSDATHVLELVKALDDHEDVQHVYANFDIPDELLEQAG
ncbi:MAG: YebC/PmpR family DNA-binding transcriptional regulator [Candidatus Omnitrophica bacterium]|nr:YebC/PmpR family DNA-binding transcriptional regulator [Candidatus Omnitrophota bacterium]